MWEFDQAAIEALRIADPVGSWRWYEAITKDMEQAAERDPYGFSVSRLLIIDERREKLWNKIREFFGEELYFRHRFRKSRVMDSSCAPQTRKERTLCEFFLWDLARLEKTYFMMVSAGCKALDAGEDSEIAARAMCEAFLINWRNLPRHMGEAVLNGNSPEVQEASLSKLSAWLEVGVKQHLRLRKALTEEHTTLRKELPAAALLGFSDLRPDEPLRPLVGRKKSLISRVSDYITKLGREATLHQGWVTNKPLDEGGIDHLESSLERFELQETAQQQLDALEQSAGLSPQQASVWGRLRSGGEIKEIAAELGISENQASVQKHNAVKKLSDARKAAGF